MKTLSPALANHLAQECSTLAYLIKITRRDGEIRAYTNHDRDLTVDGVTYRADGACDPSALVSTQELATDNLSLSGMLSGGDLAAEDLAAGRYDHARCDIYVCNWADLTQGVLQLRRGWLGEVRIEQERYSTELRGLHDRLQQEIGSYYTTECRHELGDNLCGVVLAGLGATGSVTTALDAANFIDSGLSAADHRFDYGKLLWLSGANAGLAMEIKRWNGGAQQVTLWLPMPTMPQAGDSYSVTPGCDKRFSTCKSKFGNGVNFGGFPHMPGVDKILQYPDSK